MSTCLRTASALALLLIARPPHPALAQDPAGASQAQHVRDEVARLRREFDEVREQYGQRLSELERRLAALEGQPAQDGDLVQPSPPGPPAAEAAAPAAPQATPPPVPQPTPTAEVPPGAAGAGGPPGSLPVYGGAAASSKIFNPDIAVIGNFLGAAGTNPVDPQPALQLREAEASFQAVVDPYARADFFVAVSPEGASLEEGFMTFPTLPGGLLMKVGKLYQSFGKENTMHSHVLPWTDRPLVALNLLGGDEPLADSGVSASRLILNPLFFLEATGEVYLGDSGVFQNPERSDLSYLARLRAYRDVTESTNLDLGASVAFGHNDAGDDATTRLVGLDATFRWRPLRRAIYRRLLARAELIWSRREQPGGDADAFGMYASADYQFARRWFAGVRYDDSERATDASLRDRGASLLVTFWPSEFSQVRGQYRYTRYAGDETANEFLFQFLFSIGAHGAHAF